MTEPRAANRDLAIVLNRDLLFGSRIRSALASLGLRPRFVPDTAGFVAALSTESDATAIAILDMNGAIAWDSVREALQATLDGPPTLAFGPHVDIDNRRAAKTAGVTRIVSNGQFHAEMTSLIERYRRR